MSRQSDEVFNFGSMGDSWASGVTYGAFGYTNYDDNSDGCMRINHAYGVQLRDDWPFNPSPDSPAPHNFTFAACSGARLENIAKTAPQISNIPADARFITMQAGGNDAYFYDVASSCIYHNGGEDYGAEYPDPSGKCAQAIQRSEDFLQAGSDARGIWKFTDDTINNILQVRSPILSDFKLYVLGYAHYFNTEPDSDWCDGISFSVSPSEWLGTTPKPKLSNALRSKINDLTQQLNTQFQNVVNWQNDPHVVYVSVTEGFTGHRFCEGGSNYMDQYFDPNVWFWNASPEDLFPANSGVPGLNTTVNTTTLANDQINATTSWEAAYNNNATFIYAPNIEAFDWTDLLAMDKGEGAASPHQGWSPGSALRPFHPKQYGHQSIKDVLKTQITQDFFPPANN